MKKCYLGSLKPASGRRTLSKAEFLGLPTWKGRVSQL